VTAGEPGELASPTVGAEQLEDVLEMCGPLRTGDRHPIDDRSAVRDSPKERLRELADGKNVDPEHDVRR